MLDDDSTGLDQARRRIPGAALTSGARERASAALKASGHERVGCQRQLAVPGPPDFGRLGWCQTSGVEVGAIVMFRAAWSWLRTSNSRQDGVATTHGAWPSALPASCSQSRSRSPSERRCRISSTDLVPQTVSPGTQHSRSAGCPPQDGHDLTEVRSEPPATSGWGANAS
jgi:hypothetical protein